MNSDQLGPRRSALRIAVGAGVVLLGLVGVVVALSITLKHYPVQMPVGNQSGSDRSSAVVAVLTPVIAGIAGIVGLYFGISATGSSRAQQAQTNADVARSATATATTAAENIAQVAQSATQAANSATEAAKSATQVAQSATKAASGGR
jgi:hypothetical protein